MTPPNLTNPPSRLGPKQMHTKQVRRSSRQRCAKTKTNQKTNQKTKVQDRWFYETVPALTVPALTDPALTEPALTDPVLTVPACTVPACTVPALTLTVPGAIDDDEEEDWELYYPPWAIHKHPGAWEYYKLESTQEKLRQESLVRCSKIIS